MPTASINTIVADRDSFSDLEEYVRYLAGIIASNFGEINWLTGNLDSVNIKNIIAQKIKTGILNAGKVTIKSELESGATVTIDKVGIKIEYPSGTTITFDELGFTINDGTRDVMYVDTFGNASYTGDIDVGASINVDNDVTIGEKLRFNPASFQAGIVFKTGIEIYHDPAANSLRAYAPGGVYIDGVKAAAEISSLQSRVASLEARVTALGG